MCCATFTVHAVQEAATPEGVAYSERLVICPLSKERETSLVSLCRIRRAQPLRAAGLHSLDSAHRDDALRRYTTARRLRNPKLTNSTCSCLNDSPFSDGLRIDARVDTGSGHALRTSVICNEESTISEKQAECRVSVFHLSVFPHSRRTVQPYARRTEHEVQQQLKRRTRRRNAT